MADGLQRRAKTLAFGKMTEVQERRRASFFHQFLPPLLSSGREREDSNSGGLDFFGTFLIKQKSTEEKRRVDAPAAHPTEVIKQKSTKEGILKKKGGDGQK